jgi:L-aspartate oxidase
MPPDESIPTRRYLVHFAADSIPQMFTDVLIIGGGLAGMTTALHLPAETSAVMTCKESVADCSTDRAQGGVASAFSADDSPKHHARDTVAAGCGLSDERVVQIVTEEGPDCVRELARMGVPFDRQGEEFALTREGGHDRPRILHADGDATGHAIQQVVAQRTKSRPHTQILERTFVLDLLTRDEVCCGALVWSQRRGMFVVRARRTVLATGGCGCVFRETSNPAVATGDGVAMALRAGAAVQDMEFLQFHPTTLYVAGATRALVSEAVRGEGGLLVNRDGERFMPNYHPSAELAPRDVVSRSIIEEMGRTGHTNVYLDARHMPEGFFAKRFPTISSLCAGFGLDPARDLIPVRPAAHYMIGGVRTDLRTRTSIDGLLACGEVACTGLHGANRLGSNSLLEALVFGKRCAAAIAEHMAGVKGTLSAVSLRSPATGPAPVHLNLGDVRAALKSLMWRSAGVVRDANGLAQAADMIGFWQHYVMNREFDSPVGWELQNMLTVAHAIVDSAGKRKETRGTHQRSDFPDTLPDWQRHIVR